MLAILARETARLGAGMVGAVLFAAALAAVGTSPYADTFIDRVWGLLSLDFGASLLSQTDAIAVILPGLGASAALLVPGLVLAIVLGVPLGALLAERNTQAVAVPLLQLGRAVPVFCAALLIAAATAALVPSVEPGHGLVELRDAIIANDGAAIVAAMAALAPLVLPIGFAGAAMVASIVSGAMQEALGEKYRQSLSELGLTPREILRTYVARRALALSAAAAGDVLLAAIGALAIVERLFNWPGAGAQFIHAVALHDWSVVAAIAFIIAALRIVVDFAGALASAALTGSAR
jgi:peptide/nickel transport system permease protein